MIRPLLALLVLLVARACIAQTDSLGNSLDGREESIRLGLGINFFPGSIPGDLNSTFQTPGLFDLAVPVQLGPYIRFEPELGVYLRSFQEQVAANSSQGGLYVRHADHQIVRAGFGVQYTHRVDPSFQFGLGARVGILSSEFETHSEIPASSAIRAIQDTDIHYGVFYLGGAFSVEYFISQHFSIGGEFDFLHYDFGSPLETIGTNDLSGYQRLQNSQSVWSTNELLAARFWF